MLGTPRADNYAENNVPASVHETGKYLTQVSKTHKKFSLFNSDLIGLNVLWGTHPKIEYRALLGRIESNFRTVISVK